MNQIMNFINNKLNINFWTTRRESRRKIEGRAEKGDKHWLRWGEERPWVRVE